MQDADGGGGRGRRGRRKNARHRRGDGGGDEAHADDGGGGDARGAGAMSFLHDDAREVVDPRGRQGAMWSVLRDGGGGAGVKQEPGWDGPAWEGGAGAGRRVEVKTEDKAVILGAVQVKAEPRDAGAMDVD